MVDTPVKRKIQKKDWDDLAGMIADIAQTRSRNRADRERVWHEIDRQVRMEARPSNIDIRTGRAKAGTEWMPHLELPLQAESLETLAADARRLFFPTERNYFSAHAMVSDELFARYEVSLGEIIMGENDGARVSQDNVNSIVEAIHLHYQDAYDFRSVWDQLNISAFKYGTFVGRARIIKNDVFRHDYRGVLKQSAMRPQLIPMSLWNVLLDDTPSALGQFHNEIRPGHIFTYWQKLDDIALAASRGSADPSDDNGGWRKAALRELEPYNDMGEVRVLEWEGDVVIPRSSGPSIYLPNVIVTAVLGNKDNHAIARIIRYRENKLPFNSYLIGKYHHDNDGPYASSPMEKGEPLQKAASEATNRFLQAAILNTEPPIRYDKDDIAFAATGGPRIAPRELWGSTSDVDVQQIGDPSALLAGLTEMVQQYRDVVGVSRPRLGAQTKSHQTRFAVRSEIERGVLRTVDYARATLQGPMKSWLPMEIEMIRKIMKKDTKVFVPKYKAFVNIGPDFLPEMVAYDVHGTGGPAEEEEQMQRRLQAIQLAAQAEQIAIQTGHPPLNWNEIRRVILSEGFDDVDGLIQPDPGVEGIPPTIEGGQPVQESDAGTPQDILTRVAAGIS